MKKNVLPDIGTVRPKRSRSCRAALSAAVLAAMVFSRPQPASAGPAENTKFIRKIYLDILSREPTSSEVTWDLAVMAGGTTRASLVSSFFGGSEFQTGYVEGEYLYYLQRFPTAPELSAELGLVNASSNYLASEARLASSTEYFVNAGSTNVSFVDQLYQDILYRAPSPADESYWAGRLTSGTSRNSVASSMLRSGEAAHRRVAGSSDSACNPDYLSSDLEGLKGGSYCVILNRIADPSGSTYWTNSLASSGQVPSLWSALMGSTEYYNLAQALGPPAPPGPTGD